MTPSGRALRLIGEEGRPAILVKEATPPEVAGTALVSASSRLAFTYISASMYSLDKLSVSLFVDINMFRIFII